MEVLFSGRGMEAGIILHSYSQFITLANCCKKIQEAYQPQESPSARSITSPGGGVPQSQVRVLPHSHAGGYPSPRQRALSWSNTPPRQYL